VGFPAMILAGLVILYVLMGSIAARMTWLWTSAFAQVRSIMGIE